MSPPGRAIAPGLHRASSVQASPSATRTTSNPPVPPADHRVLAAQQGLFSTSIYSPGSPLFSPSGAHVFGRLAGFLRAQYGLFGFQEVVTPTIYKKSLWEKSGHWENYRDDMFEVRGRGASGEKVDAEAGEDEVYGLKPMNCPGHCLLFASRERSYRELPVRYADFSPLHRNEVSGALSGLTRVRRFHQDDGHIFCRPAQVSREISSTLDFVAMAYKAFKLPPFKLVLSTRPEHNYIGSVEEWDRAEAALEKALDGSGREWTVNRGDGAFYGPKIDVILKDSDGKEHQTATIQLDFQLPQRFELEYRAPAPEAEKRGETTDDPELLAKSGPVRPVIIHRAVLGSLERFMALLIEHHAGRWPFWLSPRQAIILTVNAKSESVREQARTVRGQVSGVEPSRDGADGVTQPRPLDSQSFFVDVDNSGQSLGKKLARAKELGYNFVIVAGPRGVESGTVDVDITGQPGQKAVRAILHDLLGGSAEAGDGRAVRLSPGQVHELFCRLSRRYE
ncbi:MAG: hypothetical protein M1832_003806 [Thelocarpon impressellum]|nr:MAG: hypothetical protein M1832_003806 [Thelocarpon impressellum]